METKKAVGASVDYKRAAVAEDEMAEMAEIVDNVKRFKQRPQVRRVSFLVSDGVFNDLRELARTDETMTEVFKRAIACLKYLETNRQEGKRLFVGKSHDRIESEVVLLR